MGFEEARPPCPRVEFLARSKQITLATNALIDAFLLAIVILPRERGFGAFASRYTVLLRGELLAPLFVLFGNFGHCYSLPFEGVRNRRMEND